MPRAASFPVFYLFCEVENACAWPENWEQPDQYVREEFKEWFRKDREEKREQEERRRLAELCEAPPTGEQANW